MPKKTKKTKEERLAQERAHKKQKYAEIKKDPEKYATQKQKEHERYLKRKQLKKIKTVNDMTPRQLRNQRKRWRENAQRHYDKKKKEKQIERHLIENSPPNSDIEEPLPQEEDPLEGPSQNVDLLIEDNKCKNCLKKTTLLNKLRNRHRKVVGILKQKIENLTNERNNARKMVARIKQKLNSSKDVISTGKKIEIMVGDVSEEKHKEIKKRLIFGDLLSRSMKDGFKNIGNKDKQKLNDILVKDKPNFKRHKLLTEISPFTLRNKKEKLHVDNESITEKIKDFYEDDSVSRLAADKKCFITVNKDKKQKRYLCDTLLNLHKKFLHEYNIRISYSTFCKLRPRWVVFPKDSDRNTCACKIHANFDLLVKSLQVNNILSETNGSAILQSLCCDTTEENCLNRSCLKCKSSTLRYMPFNNDIEIKYEEWLTMQEKYFVKGVEKSKKVTKKTKVSDFPRNVIQKLESSMKSYMRHCSNIITQYKNLKALKNTITTQEAIIHIDFSENYCVKYNEEIQSFHFGGSRNQLSLHTCVIYLIDPEVGVKKEYSICTVSECTQHDAAAVWAHLMPTISYVFEISPSINTIHFISDSPSSHYRNRYIFYMISQLYQDFSQLKSLTWNYLEAGHGKGAPDGIGAVLKRKADQLVRFGQDMDSLKQFLTIKHQVGVEIRVVTREDIESKRFSTNIKAVKGTMTAHQVLWSLGCDKITLRKLSCFMCENGMTCVHGKHMSYIHIPVVDDDVSVNQLQQFLEENTTPDLIQAVTNQGNVNLENNSDIHIKTKSNTVSFEGNVGESNNDVCMLRQSTSVSEGTPKVKILSNIRVDDWTNISFYKTTPKNMYKTEDYQKQLENFIQKGKENQSINEDMSSDSDYSIF